MTARLTRGTTYAPGSTVNAANLMALLDSATMAGLDRSNIGSDTAQAVLLFEAISELGSSLEPGMHEDPLWPVTQVSGVPTSMIPHAKTFTLDSDSASVIAGELLVPVSYSSGSMTLRKSLSTDNPWIAFGFSAHDIQPGDQGVCVIHGLVRVYNDGTSVAAGQGVMMSSAQDGRIAAFDGYGPNKIGVALTDHGARNIVLLFR